MPTTEGSEAAPSMTHSVRSSPGRVCQDCAHGPPGTLRDDGSPGRRSYDFRIAVGRSFTTAARWTVNHQSSVPVPHQDVPEGL